MRNGLNQSPNQSWGITVLRVIVGIVFLAHGWQKLFGFGFHGTAGMFAGMGIPLPAVSSAVASVSIFGVSQAGGVFVPIRQHLLRRKVPRDDFTVFQPGHDLFAVRGERYGNRGGVEPKNEKLFQPRQSPNSKMVYPPGSSRGGKDDKLAVPGKRHAVSKMPAPRPGIRKGGRSGLRPASLAFQPSMHVR